jgi:hypothetical protein
MRYVRDNANYSPQAVTQHGKTNTWCIVISSKWNIKEPHT